MKKVILALILICIVGFLLRVMYLPQKALTFGYDQARDALQAQNIIEGDLKIQGPSASTPGLHHGVFWFYFLVPPNLVSHGDPIASAYWTAAFNTFAVIIVYLLAYSFSKSTKVGLLAALLCAVSFEATQYALWLSNPTTASWSIPLAYLGLWWWVGETKTKFRKWAPAILGMGWGLSIQANIFLLYHAVPILLWIWVGRKKITRQDLILGIGTLLASVSTIILSEAKFGFKSVSGAINLLTSGDSIVASKQLGDFILLFFNQLGRVFAFNSYPGNIGYGGVFVLVLAFLAYRSWKPTAGKVEWQPFLLTWLFAHISVVSVGGTSTPFLLVGIGPAVSILLAIFIARWWTTNKVAAGLVCALILFGNLSMIHKENPRGQTIFAIQKDMLLAKQLAAVDWTYEQANGQEFSINTLTSPLAINIVWAYLYDWHGKQVYGYVPSFHGPDQVGQLIQLPRTEPLPTRFFIQEPLAGIPLRYLDEITVQEDATSQVVTSQNWGELIVQHRVGVN